MRTSSVFSVSAALIAAVCRYGARGMFANFFHLISRSPPVDYERAFVQEVQVARQPRRDPRIERLLTIGWGLVVIKCVLVWWACARYPVPFHPLWIVLPTVAFATLCTGVYLGRR